LGQNITLSLGTNSGGVQVLKNKAAVSITWIPPLFDLYSNVVISRDLQFLCTPHQGKPR